MKTIYIGDIHGSFTAMLSKIEEKGFFSSRPETLVKLRGIGSWDFPEFIEAINSLTKEDLNGMRLFSLGDLFDRGGENELVFLLLNKLHQLGHFEMVLGNHDLFLILSLTTHNISYSLRKKAISALISNGGVETMQNFNYIYDLNLLESNSVTGEKQAEMHWKITREKMKPVIDFLMNFNIYKKEGSKLMVHGFIPISNGFIPIDGYEGLELLEYLNKGFHGLDNDILEVLAGLGPWKETRIYKDNFAINYPYTRITQVSPTWIRPLRENYLRDNPNFGNLIRSIGIDTIICGHEFNDSGEYKTTLEGIDIYRMDLSKGKDIGNLIIG